MAKLSINFEEYLVYRPGMATDPASCHGRERVRSLLQPGGVVVRASSFTVVTNEFVPRDAGYPIHALTELQHESLAAAVRSCNRDLSAKTSVDQVLSGKAPPAVTDFVLDYLDHVWPKRIKPVDRPSRAKIRAGFGVAAKLKDMYLKT